MCTPWARFPGQSAHRRPGTDHRGVMHRSWRWGPRVVTPRPQRGIEGVGTRQHTNYGSRRNRNYQILESQKQGPPTEGHVLSFGARCTCVSLPAHCVRHVRGVLDARGVNTCTGGVDIKQVYVSPYSLTALGT
jgi:hypothetical protein